MQKAKILAILSILFGIGAAITWAFAEWTDVKNTTLWGRDSTHYFWDSIICILFAVWFKLGAIFHKKNEQHYK